jgi:hypothetical protein
MIRIVYSLNIDRYNTKWANSSKRETRTIKLITDNR